MHASARHERAGDCCRQPQQASLVLRGTRPTAECYFCSAPPLARPRFLCARRRACPRRGTPAFLYLVAASAWHRRPGIHPWVLPRVETNEGKRGEGRDWARGESQLQVGVDSAGNVLRERGESLVFLSEKSPRPSWTARAAAWSPVDRVAMSLADDVLFQVWVRIVAASVVDRDSGRFVPNAPRPTSGSTLLAEGAWLRRSLTLDAFTPRGFVVQLCFLFVQRSTLSFTGGALWAAVYTRSCVLGIGRSPRSA